MALTDPNYFRIIKFMNCTQEIRRIRKTKIIKWNDGRDFDDLQIDSLAKKLFKWKMMLCRTALFWLFVVRGI